MGPTVISAIPDAFGLGMSISLSREDVNELSQDVGVQMLLRTAQTLVKGELAAQQVATRPVQQLAHNPREERGGDRSGIPPHQSANLLLEPPAATRDNLVSQSVDTLSGRQDIHNLYGLQEGGVATELSRLPLTTKGSFAPKGLFAITIPDLGVNLVSNSGDQRALKVLYWHHHFIVHGEDHGELTLLTLWLQCIGGYRWIYIAEPSHSHPATTYLHTRRRGCFRTRGHY